MYLTRVYVITDGEFVKVGVATNVLARIRTLQSANPRRFRILMFTHPIPSNEALYMECEIHKALSKHHVSGEWFDMESIEDIEMNMSLSPLWFFKKPLYVYPSIGNPNIGIKRTNSDLDPRLATLGLGSPKLMDENANEYIPF